METEPRRSRSVRSRIQAMAGDNRSMESQPSASKSRWKQLADGLLNESARVHALIDQVNSEFVNMVSDDAVHSFQVLEKDAQLRVLQAYDKGLRFAIDRQKKIIGTR